MKHYKLNKCKNIYSLIHDNIPIKRLKSQINLQEKYHYSL